MMPFTKHTQSEDHAVVSPEETEVIEDHTRQAGQKRVSSLAAAERERLLRELESVRPS